MRFQGKMAATEVPAASTKRPRYAVNFSYSGTSRA
jgi:hypothetical protein